MGDLTKSMAISASGLQSQSARMRVVAQNIANAESTSNVPGGEPYRRKTITFKNVMDKELGVERVKVDNYGEDTTKPFRARYDPAHPAADNKGYVLLPNVDATIETMDMKEAQRSYEANLAAIQASKQMLESTLELLK